STIKGGDENTPAVWATGSSDEIDLILDVLAAEGVDMAKVTKGGSGNSYTLSSTPKNLLDAQSKVQIGIDGLSTRSQSDQSRVQTAMGRFNSMIELVSSLIKKD